MIKSLLIANRGEIAIRIARTAKRMGIKTFAIRTKKEPNAVYLQKVDQVVDFPDTDGSVPEFLDIKNLVKLAVDNNIEAMHPGYGYLSENPDFAAACRDAGVIFVGPSPEIIHAMGDKIVAKEIAKRSNVPMLGGTLGDVMGDTFDKVPNELTKNPIAVDKQKKLIEEISFSISAKSIFANCSGVFATLNKSFVTMFTRASVHCAESITATSNSNGVVKSNDPFSPS